MISQSLVIILPRFIDFERPKLILWVKFKKSEAIFVAICIMNKCAKLHVDISSGYRLKIDLASSIKLSETAHFGLQLFTANLTKRGTWAGTFDEL